MTKHTYYNRYGDAYTFSMDLDGNVLWEGEFKYCRFAWPNIYDVAYQAYVEDGMPYGFMELDDFKEKVHEYVGDWDGGDGYTMKDRKYRELVYSDTKKISMVDPSGGPYMAVGMPMRYIPGFDDDAKIVDFVAIETGYKILIEK